MGAPLDYSFSKKKTKPLNKPRRRGLSGLGFTMASLRSKGLDLKSWTSSFILGEEPDVKVRFVLEPGDTIGVLPWDKGFPKMYIKNNSKIEESNKILLCPDMLNLFEKSDDEIFFLKCFCLL